MQSNISRFITTLVLPISQNEDRARVEFILNVLLLSVAGLAFFAFVISLIGHLLDGLNANIPTGIIFIVLSFFIFLYFLSRKGFLRLSSYGLLTIFFLPVTYQVYIYGVDLPSALLTYSLIIIMAGVLINTRVAVIITALVSSVVVIIGYLQNLGIVPANRYWVTEGWNISDMVVASVIFLIIATVSWLSNREIEKSLARARRSEAELKKERDFLEIAVEERTKELKETQAEKMAQLYRFAEFGRLSSGLFHDLINPLTAVSLNMEKVKESEMSEYLNNATVAAKKMGDMVNAVRKQLLREENEGIFSLNAEIEQVIEVLAHKAQKANVAIHFSGDTEILTYGDAVKFNQVILNLIANAIDADGKSVQVALGKENSMVVLSVKDQGVGIAQENISKIFEPFFTTKVSVGGMGIGLSITKRIVEKDFDGSVEVASKEGVGSVFTVKFPQKNNDQEHTKNN